MRSVQCVMLQAYAAELAMKHECICVQISVTQSNLEAFVNGF